MVIYVSVVLNLSVRMLYFIYKNRGDYDTVKPVSKTITPPASPATTPINKS